MKDKFYNLIVNKSKGRFAREIALTKNKRSIKASENSPKRLEMLLQKQVTENEENKKKYVISLIRNLPHFIKAYKSVNKSLETLEANSFLPKKRFNQNFIDEFEKYAKSLGISDIGYTTIKPEYIFRDRAVLYKGVIVLTKEMDKKVIDLAPSSKTQRFIWQSYDTFGKTTNQLAEYLRKKGYGAQAGPPLAGLAIYPALAESAGIGAVGKNGLLISPKYGPRQRIAVIYTSIEGFPKKENQHLWIKDFCNYCNKCVRECPEKAIYEQTIKTSNGSIKCIDSEKCLNSFINNHGCSICIKQCPFNNVGYEKIKTNFKKHR